jgi:hypothetical protein
MRYAINREIVRPDPELTALFADLAVADVCDVLGRNAALPSALKPLGRAQLLKTFCFTMLWTTPCPAMCWWFPAPDIRSAPSPARLWPT